MSIIYGTLERLEQGETQARTHPLPQAETGTSGFSLRYIVTALVGAGMGVALVLWSGGGASDSRDRLGPVKVETALITEPVPVEVPEYVEPRPVLAEITVEKTRLAPVVFEAAVKPAPPVAAASPAAEPPTAAVAAPAAAPEPAPVPVAVEDGVGPVIDRARVALSRGSYGRALSTLAELESIPENRSEYWFIKGSAHLGLGQLEPAEAALSAARSLAPMSAQVVVQLSILHQERGDHALAVEMLDEAATRHPQVPEIYLNLGYSQLALGAEAQARASFRAFLDLSADSAFYATQRVAIAQWLSRPGGA